MDVINFVLIHVAVGWFLHLVEKGFGLMFIISFSFLSCTHIFFICNILLVSDTDENIM